MSASINMIVIKHFKQEVGRSVLDLCLDKELPNLLAILPIDLEKCFYPKFGDKNLFRSESDQTESLLLDVMKHLRLNKWNLLTSNSFAHLSLEKTVESHFYFEKVTKSTIVTSKSTEDEEVIDDERMKSFTAFLRHQFNEYENAKARGGIRTQISYDTDQNSSPHQPKYGSPMASSQKPNSIPPEVVALIFEKTSQQSGPYAFAKRASAAGVSPSRRAFAPEVTENFSKAQQQIAEAEAEELQRQQEHQRVLQQQHAAQKAALPPLAPTDPEKKATTQNPVVSNRLVQKYQPVRKSIAGISPRLDIQPGDVDQEADMSNFYEAKHNIAEFNPLHGSTPRGTTPVPSISENTSVEATVSAPSPVTVTPTGTISPVPFAAVEPNLTRQPSAADKLLSKYRRKSSFSLNKSSTNGIASTTTAAQVEEAVNNTNNLPSSIPPVSVLTSSTPTDSTTLAAAAAAAAAKRASLPPLETSSVSPVSHPDSGSGSATPTKRASFFALQNGGSAKPQVNATEASEPPVAPVSASVSAASTEVKSVFPSVDEPVVPPAEDVQSSSTSSTITSAPKPSLQVIELSIDTEKPLVDDAAKKSPSITPTSAGTSKSFLSRYQPKKRSIAGSSSNNLRVELQQANVLPAAPSTEQTSESVTVSTAAASETHSLVDSTVSPLPVPDQPSTTMAPPVTNVVLPPVLTVIETREDILQSLPEIPTSYSTPPPSHTIDPSIAASKEVVEQPPSSQQAPSIAHLPPPPAAEAVIAILEAQTASPPPVTTHSLVNDIEAKTPFAAAITHDHDGVSAPSSSSVYDQDSKNTPTLEYKEQPVEVTLPPPSIPDMPVVSEAVEVPAASVSTSSSSSLTANAMAEDPAPPTTHPDEVEVAYAEKSQIATSSTLMRQLAAAKSAEADPELQQHESEKTNHYAKLGSAFVTNNALGRGGRGAGRGRGRGL